MRRILPQTRATGPAGAAARAPSARQAPLPRSLRCACGGGCPRCAPGAAQDPAEAEADRMAHRALGVARTPPALARAMGVDPAGVRLHADAGAAEAARAQHAHAYTVGRDIVFGAGRLAPQRAGGAFLLAHELAHVAQQQRSGVRLQRQAADVTFPDQPISGALRPVQTGVSHLEDLTTPVGPDEIDTGRTDDHAPDPAQRLPFTEAGGWESGEILTRVGQIDQMPGTDSDANRCVQAVAMASHIVEGPEAVKQYLNAVLLEAELSRPRGARENKARQVLQHFIARLDNRLATYGDVAWAQEALHDLFYTDREGTPEADIPGTLAKTMGPQRTLQRLDVWCDTPAEVVAQAQRLQPGEQLLVVPVTVTFNQALDEAGSDLRGAAAETDVRMSEGGPTQHVTRFDASRRPPSTAIDRARDRVSGHQVLIMRDATTGELRVYEPEAVDSGDHFMELDTEGRNFESAFRDRPQNEIYGYVQVIAKIAPRTPPPRMFSRYQPSWI